MHVQHSIWTLSLPSCPFGSVSASEIFQQVMSAMVEDIGGSEAVMDDIVVWGKDQAEHDMRRKQVMDSVTHTVYHKHARGL